MYSVLYVLGLYVYMYVISNTMKGGMRYHILHTTTTDNFCAA